MELGGSVVIVTGASSGIGAATARFAAGLGAKGVLAARRWDRIRDLADKLPDALAVETDMRDPAQIVRLVEATWIASGAWTCSSTTPGSSRRRPSRR